MVPTINGNNNDKTPDIPMGLSMALAQNTDAMDYFTALSDDEQQEIINHTNSIQSKQEMENYVDDIVAPL